MGEWACPVSSPPSSGICINWLPDASIDIAIAYSRSEELLGHLPGVRNVIVCFHTRPIA